MKTHRESKDTFNAQRYLYHDFSGSRQLTSKIWMFIQYSDSEVFSTHVLSFGFGKRRISITSFGQGLIQTAYLRPLFGALLWCQGACLPWTESLSRNWANSWKASFVKMRFLTIHHFVTVNTDHHTRALGTLKCAINHFCHVRNTIGNLVAMILRSVTMATWLHHLKLTNVPLYQGSLFIVSRRCWARGDVLSDLDVRWNHGGRGAVLDGFDFLSSLFLLSNEIFMFPTATWNDEDCDSDGY